jgi:hypothetical protein
MCRNINRGHRTTQEPQEILLTRQMSSSNAQNYASPFASTYEVIITARLLQTLFLRSLDSSFLNYTTTNFDFYLIGGPRNLYGIKPGLAQGLWYTLQRLGRIILCAAHGYVPGASTGPLPYHIPHQALEEINMNFPTVVLSEIYPDNNPLVSAQPLVNLKLAIATIQCVGRRGLTWITEAMRRSARNGEESLWKWGSLVELRDAHPDNFGLFADRVIQEIDYIRQKTLTEELFFDEEDEENEGERSNHAESTVIDDLRRFLVSHHTVFTTQNYQPVKLGWGDENSTKPTELDELVEVLDELGLTDIAGIPLKGWTDD